jgi:hypothetical protein
MTVSKAAGPRSKFKRVKITGRRASAGTSLSKRHRENANVYGLHYVNFQANDLSKELEEEAELRSPLP